ncbi:MAG TPA: hypothetical protein VF148_07630 [Acidimicrobiia bacterium]
MPHTLDSPQHQQRRSQTTLLFVSLVLTVVMALAATVGYGEATGNTTTIDSVTAHLLLEDRAP